MPPLQTHANPLPLGLQGKTYTAAQKLELREQVREMFFHSWDAYMKYAHPHDELKLLSLSWADGLAELGNAARAKSTYRGVAMTMIDSLSTLAVSGRVR